MADVPFLTIDRDKNLVALPTAKLVAEAVAAMQTALESRLALLDTRVDGLETLGSSQVSALQTIQSYVDQLETLAGTGNTALAAILTEMQSSVAAAITAAQLPSSIGQKAISNSLSVVLATAHAAITVLMDGVADAALTTGWAANTALDTTGYGAAIISVAAIGGTSPSITITSTLTGAVNHPVAIINLATNTIVSSITAVGLYQVTAVGSLKYTLAGTSPTATVNVLLKR